MSEPISVSVRSSLQSIIDELEKVKAKAQEVQEEMKNSGNGVEEGLKDNTKRVATFFGSLRSLSRRVGDQLRGDFKSLVSINAVSDSLKLSNQFKGTVSETISLSDKIRKLGSTFGIAKSQFASFQSYMTEGLGELGMSSDVATRVLEGLSTTPVRGKSNILAYSTQAGMLGSISGEGGKEGEIAKGLARVTMARGGDVDDPTALNALSEAVRKVFTQTGALPTQTLSAMEQMFKGMPEDLRKKIGSVGLANLAAVSAVGGPNATKFVEQYSSMSPVERMAIDAQGGGNLLSDKGLDLDKLKRFIDSAASRVGGDPRLGLQTAGIDSEAAEGLIRLRENLDKVKDAQDRIIKSTGSLNEQYKDSMGFSEAFRANLNRVKKMIAEPLAMATQAGTDALSKASQSDIGAGAVAVGGGLLAAVLAGGGLRGIGKGLGLGKIAGTLAKKEGAEALLGEKTIPVYVVNANEIGGGGLGAVAGSAGGTGLLGKVGAVGAAAAVGVGIGEIIRPYVDEWFAKNTAGALDKGGVKGDGIDKLMYQVDKILGGDSSKEIDRRDHVTEAKAGFDRIQNPSTGPTKILVPKASGTVAATQDSTKQNGKPATDSMKAPAASAFPSQPTRVIVEMNDPRLKSTTKYPSQGASN